MVGGEPCSPYPSFAGIFNFLFSPTHAPSNPWSQPATKTTNFAIGGIKRIWIKRRDSEVWIEPSHQPLITWPLPNSNSNGSSLSKLESNTVPSVSFPCHITLKVKQRHTLWQKHRAQIFLQDGDESDFARETWSKQTYPVVHLDHITFVSLHFTRCWLKL